MSVLHFFKFSERILRYIFGGEVFHVRVSVKFAIEFLVSCFDGMIYIIDFEFGVKSFVSNIPQKWLVCVDI